MPLLCTTTTLDYFYSATLAWNSTAVDNLDGKATALYARLIVFARMASGHHNITVAAARWPARA